MTPEASPTHPGPLHGLRVIELGQILAGPFAGAIFADLGAEVLKIERVDGGDDGRRMGPVFRGGDALNFHLFNRGKKSLALNLKSEAGLAAFEQLVASADILIHNLRPGVTEDMGIDGPSLCQRHPRLIYGEISAFGHTGPMQSRPGYEPLLQAFSGLSSTNGGPDDPPMRLGASVVDQGTGMWVVIGTLAMLQQRHLTGRGGVLHSSLLETALTWNAQKSEALIHEGREPMRHASGHSGFVPYEAFETLDGPPMSALPPTAPASPTKTCCWRTCAPFCAPNPGTTGKRNFWQSACPAHRCTPWPRLWPKNRCKPWACVCPSRAKATT